MNAPDKPTSRLFDVGPVSLVRWKESEGREILESSGDLARQLQNLGVERLDDVLGPEDRERLEAAICDLLSDCGGSDIGPVEMRLGEGAPAWFHLTALASEADGEQDQVVATFVDINGLMGSQHALREKSDRLELVIDGTRLGTWDWNPQTGDVCFNQHWAQMLGHSLDEIDFRLDEWESRVHPEDLAPCYEAIQAHLSGETPFYENVHRMRHRDGHWVHILDRGRVVERDADGQPVRFTGTHTDISAQREAELAAQAASRIKSEFLATMSHEIRTPLCGIMGLIEVLESTGISEAQREHTALIKRCGDHLRVVLDEVLELTRLESRSLELQMEAFDLNMLAKDLHGLFLGEALSKGIELRPAPRISPPAQLIGDRHRLQQVFSNLLSNAVKFTDEGHVELDLWLEESPLRLHASVKDTGRGITNPERIWEVFQQEDATIAANYGGSGLGLTITQELIQLMGGTIKVQSTREQGSCFEISVPVDRAAPAAGEGLRPGRQGPEGPGLDARLDPGADREADPEANRTGPPSRPGGAENADLETPSETSHQGPPSPRVLAADDNPVNRQILGHFLGELGLEYEVVEDGQAAIDAASASPFDLVLLDLQMPRCCGVTAARAIKSQAGTHMPRIVAVTADVFNALQLEESDALFDAVVTKPFCLGDIRAQVFETAAGLPRIR